MSSSHPVGQSTTAPSAYSNAEKAVINGGNSFGLLCCAGTLFSKGLDLTCLAPCIGIFVCNYFFDCFSHLCQSHYTASKVYSIIFFFMTILIAVILLTNDSNNGSSYGVQAVYRIAFTDFIFFIGIAFFTKISVMAHIYYWPLKIILWVAFCTGMFYVDNDPFIEWTYFARVASLLWLLIQAIVLIEICFSAHSSIMMQAENEDDRIGPYKSIYLIISFFVFSGALTGNIFLYKFYAEDCKLNQFLISLTLVFGIINVFCSIHPKIDQGLLTPCLVFLYLTYSIWDSILSSPSSKCNPFQNYGASNVIVQYIAIILLAAAIVKIAFSVYNTFSKIVPESVTNVTSEEGEEIENSNETGEMSPELEMELTGEGAKSGNQLKPTEEDGAVINEKQKLITIKEEFESKMVWLFYFSLSLASCYFAMALTDWGYAEGNRSIVDIKQGEMSMWVKIVAQWVTILYYQLVLWAPILRGDD